MKTTMVIDDDLYLRAKVIAAQRGKPVASLVEEALRLHLAVEIDASTSPVLNLPTWDMGEASVDINDSRSLRNSIDAGLSLNALR